MFYQYTATFQQSSRTVFIKAVLAAKGSLNSEQTQLHALDKDHNVLVPIGNIGMLPATIRRTGWGAAIGVQQGRGVKYMQQRTKDREPDKWDQNHRNRLNSQ
jgi:archaeosine-15-forming tRNA-guanine transglycosylase